MGDDDRRLAEVEDRLDDLEERAEPAREPWVCPDWGTCGSSIACAVFGCRVRRHGGR